MGAMIPPPRRYGGVLMTDQRGPGEGVILMRLMPAEDEPDALEFDGRLVLAAVHMHKATSGLQFDISSAPVVYDGAGKPLPLLENGRVQDAMLGTFEKVRSHLRARSEQGARVPRAIADQLRFFVFGDGGAPVTMDWRVQFAGKTYPLQGPTQAG